MWWFSYHFRKVVGKGLKNEDKEGQKSLKKTTRQDRKETILSNVIDA